MLFTLQYTELLIIACTKFNIGKFSIQLFIINVRWKCKSCFELKGVYGLRLFIFWFFIFIVEEIHICFINIFISWL